MRPADDDLREREREREKGATILVFVGLNKILYNLAERMIKLFL